MIPQLQRALQSVLKFLYHVELVGYDNLEKAGNRVLIVANHTSFLDAVLLGVFIPDRLTFAVNTQIAKAWWVKPFLTFVDFFPMDPTNPLSTKSLIKHLQSDCKAVIFPEGRITVTGSLMKIYQGPGLVAERSGATLLPVRIDGAQYTPFSRLRGRVRLRWFPKIQITIMSPRQLDIPDSVQGRARRNRAGLQLADIMTEMMFQTSHYRRTVVEALLDARTTHGDFHRVVEDVERKPLNYGQLLTRVVVLGDAIAECTAEKQYVGVLLPNMNSTVITFFALHFHRRIPAMLNFTVGVSALKSALHAAHISTVLTSRRFVQAGKLDDIITGIQEVARVVFLEDLVANITFIDRIDAWFRAHSPWLRRSTLLAVQEPDDPAVVLFTSGSEGVPKGVVLSHANLLANREQLAARVDFGSQDIILNALPLFHSFGLTAGTLLPLLSGMKVFFYPSPLHYRIIPEIAYDINATILFGTNTFLAGYARFAHPYDFYSVRYVFAGAERLAEETRRVWAEKFGIRIFEGYGATETSPVIATNTAMDHKAGTVGRILPGIRIQLEPVPGVTDGARLYVAGPNVMLGYLLATSDGAIIPPKGELGEGWYDTGDVVSIDDEGFVTIRGRAKRFAKIGGEMVSLTAVEQMVCRLWPKNQHAVVSLPDPAKGEQLVLLTDMKDATRQALSAYAKSQGIGELGIPRNLLVLKALPVLGTGKVDYVQARRLAAEQLGVTI